VDAEPIYRVDRALGEALERSLRAHHRRRLDRIGWDHVFDPHTAWARGGSPPRPGTSLEVLVDGEEAFGAMAATIAAARDHVHVAGWHVEPDFPLPGDAGGTLEDVLAGAGRNARVRVLLWAGAPLPPPFRPRRAEAAAVAARLGRLPGVDVALDSKERLLHCHHEKIVVVDGAVAFVGGFDFSTLGASRLDASHHPPRDPMGWHDAAFRIEGPLVGDVAAHFALRWRETTGEDVPAASPGACGDVEAQLVRTVPEKVYEGLPRGEFTLLESYVGALRGAQRLVYLENQFLWSSEIVKILAGKLRNPPRDDFRVVLVLPSKPATGKDDTLGQLAVLAEADDGAGRFVASTLHARSGAQTKPVYVHAKVGVVDDRWLTIGSGNLNNHSLFNDSEVNVVTHDAALARETRLRLWSEHLEVSVDALEGRDPAEVVDDLWIPTAVEQLERREAGEPPTHRLTRLPHVSKRSKRLLGPLQTFLVDG
jgi:phosphatidylserine/phosphatidylglycerophosphate/cardiolipin synthase-like enzyme